MHEVSIATELWRMCRAARDECAGEIAAARARGHERGDDVGSATIRHVRIAVGEFASLDPKLLAYAWADVAAEPDAPAPELCIEWCPARQVCPSCGEIAERQPGSWLRLCPACSGPLRVEGGGELDLIEIRFEEPTGALSC